MSAIRRCASVLIFGLLVLACIDHPTHPGPASETASRYHRAGVGASAAWTIDDEFDRLAREVIPGFGGFFFDEDGNPVVYLTDTTARAAADRWVGTQLRSLGRPAQALVVRHGPFDYTELKRWHDALLPILMREEVYWLDIDESVNVLRIAARDTSTIVSVSADATARGIPAHAVRTEVRPRPAPRLSLEAKTRPVDGGFQIDNIARPGQYCTLGFNALQSGHVRFVTASHCSADDFSEPDDGIEYQHMVADTNRIGLEVSDTPPYACDGPGTNCRWSDAATFGYDTGVLAEVGYIARTYYYGVGSDGSSVVDNSKPRFTITGKSDGPPGFYVGLWVNKVGRTTGWTRGPITQSCVTLQSRGVELRCQMVASVWSRPGDSGSPLFFAGGTTSRWRTGGDSLAWLQGVLWGGPPADWTTTWYSPIQGVETDLGVFIVTPALDPVDLDASIDGPVEIRPNAICTWEAVVSGGTGTYYYNWYNDGIPVGASRWYTGGKDPGSLLDYFVLRVDVTDSESGFGSDTLIVYENESAPVCIQPGSCNRGIGNTA